MALKPIVERAVALKRAEACPLPTTRFKDRDSITERKLEILRMIRCDEKTERKDVGKAVIFLEPDFDVYPIIDRCKRYITHLYTALK